jgi:hypothetical protein
VAARSVRVSSNQRSCNLYNRCITTLGMSSVLSGSSLDGNRTSAATYG